MKPSDVRPGAGVTTTDALLLAELRQNFLAASQYIVLMRLQSSEKRTRELNKTILTRYRHP